MACEKMEEAALQNSSFDDMDDDDDDEDEVTDSTNFASAECSFDKPATCYAQQISLTEYNKLTTEYTKMALESLVSSPEYQHIYTRCRLCWCCWSEGQFSANCMECGGFAMVRPCPVCTGRCGAIWKRDVELSHSNSQAFWNGNCCLPHDQQMCFLTQVLIDGDVTEADILDGLEDLNTTE